MKVQLRLLLIACIAATTLSVAVVAALVIGLYRCTYTHQLCIDTDFATITYRIDQMVYGWRLSSTVTQPELGTQLTPFLRDAGGAGADGRRVVAGHAVYDRRGRLIDYYVPHGIGSFLEEPFQEQRLRDLALRMPDLPERLREDILAASDFRISLGTASALHKACELDVTDETVEVLRKEWQRVKEHPESFGGH
jgi:hypothetical protein